MELRYRGFEQKQNKRAYKFERVAKGEPSTKLVVTADLDLFLKHHVGIQEGPSLCAHKLASDLHDTGEPTLEHELTNEDLLAYASARAAAQARRAESRRAGLRRRPRSQNAPGSF
jgi:hypothetical protein